MKIIARLERRPASAWLLVAVGGVGCPSGDKDGSFTGNDAGPFDEPLDGDEIGFPVS